MRLWDAASPQSSYLVAAPPELPHPSAGYSFEASATAHAAYASPLSCDSSNRGCVQASRPGLGAQLRPAAILAYRSNPTLC